MSELEKFADRKRLRIAFLTEYGVELDANGIRFTNGAARPRIRARADSHTTTWEPGAAYAMRVYGYDRVAQMAKWNKTVLVVEGESDALSGWFHKMPALGVPGSTMHGKLELEDVAPFDRVVVIREPGQAGLKFAVNVPKRLRELGYSGMIVIANLPMKDLSDLHVRYADDAAAFDSELDAAIEAAKPAESPTSVDAVQAVDVEWDDAHPWPTLHEDALYGLAGDIIRAALPETEADPTAMLFSVLAAAGNAAGPGRKLTVGDDDHPARLFVAIVGETSTGKKGTSWAAVRPFFRAAAPEWFSAAQRSGFGSGESLVSAFDAPKVQNADDYEPVEMRALVFEPEFARILTVNGREGSTLSPILRQAWDGARLESRRAQGSRIVDCAHVSVLAHITPDELRGKLSGNDIAGGFANRFLFVCSHRSKMLPSGGNLTSDTIAPLAKRLNDVIRYAVEHPLVMRRTPAAEVFWDEVYQSEPDRGGLIGEVTARNRAQMLRLSVAYAILDGVDNITRDHLAAARAAWNYCVASAEHVFGGRQADDLDNRLLDQYRATWPNGLDGTEIQNVLGRHVSAARLKDAHSRLEACGLIRQTKVATDGRPRIVHHAVTRVERAKHREKSEQSEISPTDLSLSSLSSLSSQVSGVTEPCRFPVDVENVADVAVLPGRHGLPAHGKLSGGSRFCRSCKKLVLAFDMGDGTWLCRDCSLGAA